MESVNDYQSAKFFVLWVKIMNLKYFNFALVYMYNRSKKNTRKAYHFKSVEKNTEALRLIPFTFFPMLLVMQNT